MAAAVASASSRPSPRTENRSRNASPAPSRDRRRLDGDGESSPLPRGSPAARRGSAARRSRPRTMRPPLASPPPAERGRCLSGDGGVAAVPAAVVRHSGRVHVRGMIRRVWRPRFLELHGDGAVRYYEAAASVRGSNGGGDGGGRRGQTGGDASISRLGYDGNAVVAVTSAGLNTTPRPNRVGTDGRPAKGADGDDGDSRVGSDDVSIVDAPSYEGDGDILSPMDGKKMEGAGSWNHIPDAAVEEAHDSSSPRTPTAETGRQRAGGGRSGGGRSGRQDSVETVHAGNCPRHKRTARRATSSMTDEGEEICDGNDLCETAETSKEEQTSGRRVSSDGGGAAFSRNSTDGGGDSAFSTPPPGRSASRSASADGTPAAPGETHSSEDEPHHRRHRHRPKAVLVVLHARVIDPTTFRDMHVGLPKGSYGFLFRGCAVDRTTDRARWESRRPPPPLDRQLSSNLVTRSDYRRGSEGGGDYRPGSPDSTMGCSPAPAPQQQLSHRAGPSVPPGDGSSSRDYLCAVPTLEEAQCWVVALKWAASVTAETAARIAARYDGDGGEPCAAGGGTDSDDASYASASVAERWASGALGGEGPQPQPPASGIGSYIREALKGVPSKESLLLECSSVGGGDLLDEVASLSSVGSGPTTRRRKKGKKKGATQTIASKSSSIKVAGTAATTKSSVRSSSRQGVIGDGRVTPVSSGSNRSASGAPNGSGEGGGGVIVVTKVRGYRLDWRTNAWNSSLTKWLALLAIPNPRSCRLQYEVRLVLLKVESIAQKTARRRKPTKKSVETEGVEERTVHRSYGDLVDLVRSLRRQMNDDSSSSSNPTSSSSSWSQAAALDVLRRAEDDLHSGRDPFTFLGGDRKATASASLPNIDFRAPLSPNSPFWRSVDGETRRVDRVLRLLATHPDLCNTGPLREFLGMSPLTNDAAESASTMIYQRPDESTDEFVRRWILNDAPPAAADDVGGGWRGRRAQLVIAMVLRDRGGAAVASATAFASTMVVYRALVLYWTRMAFALEVRVDVLMVVLAVAYYLGHSTGSSQRGIEVQPEKDIVPPPLSQRTEDATGALDEAAAKDRIVESVATASVATDVQSDGTASTTDEDLCEDDSTTLVSIGEGALVSTEPPASAVAEKSFMLPSPLPRYPNNDGQSCWSKPDDSIFRVRGPTYLTDRVKLPSAPAPFECRGVDVWLTDNPERHIARHPSVLGGKLRDNGGRDTFVVNFLLPTIGNFVSYFAVPPPEDFPPNLARVWGGFLAGDQQYRDARLKMLPVVLDGPWIVRRAVGPGSAPALLGRVIPLQYFFTPRSSSADGERGGTYEVDVIISASRIATAILSVVKGHTKSLSIGFAFIIEAADEEELPETVLCSFQIHELHLEDCPELPDCRLDDDVDSSTDDE